MELTKRSCTAHSEVKIRRRKQLTHPFNCNRPWIIFILVYLSSFLVQSTHSFVPLKEKPSSSQSTNNHLLHSSSSLPSYASFIASINASIINANKQTAGGSSVGTKKNPNGFKNAHNEKIIYPINEKCSVDSTMTKVLCQGLRSKRELPQMKPYFLSVEYAEFVDVTSPEFVKRTLSYSDDVTLEDVHELFPNVVHLNINHSPRSNLSALSKRLKGKRLSSSGLRSMALVRESEDSGGGFNKTNASSGEQIRLEGQSQEEFKRRGKSVYRSDEEQEDYKGEVAAAEEILEMNDEATSDREEDGKVFTWESVKHLNMSWNKLTSDGLFGTIMNTFPNLESLDISNNFVSEVAVDLIRIPNLRSIDISGNPLDCTSDLNWLENHDIELIHPDQTLCDQPPHQNKAKPLKKVIRLIKKVREECKVNCTCDIAYIWEQNHIIHSKNSVNCSNKGFTDFPDPDKLPHPTDTLDLSNNQITSIQKFVEDDRYVDLNVMNLYLDNNQISSIDLLEGSEWFYSFQVFNIRNNSITEVPVYVLESVFQQNKRILQIDLSMNDFHCECVTFSTFKIWLLRYSANIKHIDDVRCSQTGESIRYLKREDWCKVDNGEALLDLLDVLSIILALIIFLVIAKVYYDYWNFKTNGKLPWLVRKM